MAMTSRVKSTLFRRSATLKMFFRLESNAPPVTPRRCAPESTRLPVGERVAPRRRAPVTEGQRQDLDGAAGALDGAARPTPRRRGPATVHGPVQLPASEDLDQRALADEARGASVVGVASSPGKASRVSRLTTAYSTRKGLWKPLSLGMRWASGSWPPSKPGGTLPRAPVPLVPRPAVLPPLPAMPRPTRRRDGSSPPVAQVMEFHASSFVERGPRAGAGVSSIVAILRTSARRGGGAIALVGRLLVAVHPRCGTRASMPRISGRSGRIRLPTHAAQAQRAQRAPVLGLGADARAHLGDAQVSFGVGGRSGRAHWHLLEEVEARWRSR